MKTFRDVTGREWTLGLTIGGAKRVRSLVGVDLLDPMSGEPPLLQRLGVDVVLLVDCVYALVKSQADAASVDDQAFAEALGADAATALCEAFYGEWTDFFRQCGRPHEAKAIAKQRAVIRTAIQLAEQRIEQIDPESLATTVMERTISGTSSGSSPEPSGSIRTR